MQRIQDHGHIRALDGIRGTALILVFLYHALRSTIQPSSFVSRLILRFSVTGWMGVDLFFVLSGFLITTILLDARKSDNYFSVFYARRVLRIFPLYYLVTASALILEPGHASWKREAFYWLNLSNLPTAFNPVPIGYLAHLWSLAIEEQFYFVWPSFIRWVAPRTLAKGCIGVILGLFLVRNLPQVIALNDRWPELLYRLTPFRIDTLCAGALLAIVVKFGPDLSRYRPHLRALCVSNGLIFFAVAFGKTYDAWHVVRFGYTAILLCAASLIALSLFAGSRTARIFSNPFLRATGKYSYSFYLFHPFVVNFVAPHIPGIHAGLQHIHLRIIGYNATVLLTVATEFVFLFATSAISWRFFEGPILGLKRHFRYRPLPEHYLA